MKNFNLPPIGARNLKTALAAFICIILFQILNKPSAFFACIASMMCMQDTFENSIKMGKNRMIGTLIGGLVGLIITFLSIKLGNSEFVCAILTALGTIASIYLCVLSKAKGAVNSACIVTFAILTNIKGSASYIYAINRIIDTFIGVIIGILVNRHIYPYSKNKIINEKNDDKLCNKKNKKY
ncbi:FUSC family protein [Clostridium tarantellae]|uniref:FUSC family protein n=1 Tax=Clostridium tarantellae TaxID=39493 RepID=A0A6I1MLS8_9CLOT|nr:aromatic acid exporter family protein [Clostridium tarantellae]MPQ43693.1 hypothetical protein [Clostridium tarantellae]